MITRGLLGFISLRLIGALGDFDGVHLSDPCAVWQDLVGLTGQLGVIHV